MRYPELRYPMGYEERGLMIEIINPAHGFGTFCPATRSAADRSTIGREKQVNPVLTQRERDYIDGLLAGLDACPASVLAAAGRRVVAVDDEFDRAARAGLPMAAG